MSENKKTTKQVKQETTKETKSKGQQILEEQSEGYTTLETTKA